MITRGLLLVLLLAGTILPGCESDRAPEVHLVPVGYEGPLIMLYNQPGYPVLPRSGDSLVFDFRPSYVLRTSSPLVAGSGFAESFRYYYVDDTGRRIRIRKVVDEGDLRQRLPDEACVLFTATEVHETGVSELITSARKARYNSDLQRQATDSLMIGESVTAPYKSP